MATNVIMPRQGQSVETCIIGELYKKKGDHVTEGEIILSYETDKAAFDLESPASGIILEIFCKTGDEVGVLTNIAVIGQPGESINEFVPKETSLTAVGSASASAPEAAQLTDVQKTEDQVITTDRTDKIKISPRARNLASRLNIDVSQVKGTGPMGKIIEKDIEIAAAASQTTNLASDVIKKEGKESGKQSTGHSVIAEEIPDINEYIIKKISNVRRIIAENMHSSLKIFLASALV